MLHLNTTIMKKVIFSICIAATAICSSAFTTIENGKTNKFMKVYFQKPNGKYVSNPDVGLCSSSNAIHGCTLQYTNSTPGAENFTYSEKPAGNFIESENGFYEPL